MRPDAHLVAAEDYEHAAQATEDPILRSIYRNLAELHRLIDAEMQRLAEWHRQQLFGDDAPPTKPTR
jgi:hypothetical protein